MPKPKRITGVPECANGTTARTNASRASKKGRMSPNPDHIGRVRNVCAITQRLGLLEMTNHEFLDSSRRVQRATLSDGMQITSDFTKKSDSVEMADKV